MLEYLQKHPRIWLWVSLVPAITYQIFHKIYSFELVSSKDMGTYGILTSEQKFAIVIIYLFITFSIISIITNKNILPKLISYLLLTYYLFLYVAITLHTATD